MSDFASGAGVSCRALSLIHTTNTAKCPDLPPVDPGLLIPSSAFAVRIRTDVFEAKRYSRRIRALEKRLARELNFAELQRFMRMRLGPWCGNELNFPDITDIATTIVCMGPASLHHLAPPAAGKDGRFIQRLRAILDVTETCEGSATSSSSVSVFTTSSRLASRAAERSSLEMAELAAKHALAATTGALQQASAATMAAVGEAAQAASHAALQAAAPTVEAMARSAAADVLMGAGPRVAAVAKSATEDAMRAASPQIEAAVQLSAKMATGAALEAASPRLQEMAQQSACAAAGAALEAARLEAMAHHSARAATGAAMEAAAPKLEATAQRAAQAALMEAEARAARREADLLSRIDRLGRALAELAGNRAAQKQHAPDDESSSEWEAPRTPTRQGAPGLTATPLGESQAWAAAVGTGELARLAEEVIAMAPNVTGRLFARAAFDGAIMSSNMALRHGDLDLARDIAMTMARRMLGAIHVYASGMGNTERGAKEALAAVLAAEDASMSKAGTALKKLEPLLQSPPTSSRKFRRGGTGRNDGGAAEGPHHQRSASKQPHKKKT